MAEFNPINQFGSVKPARPGAGISCLECEALLSDVMDGTLSPQQKAAFDLHTATCSECSQMLADARRGASLLDLLKSPRPEPSAALLDRIIARTSGLPEQAKSTSATLMAVPAIDGMAPEIHGVVAETATIAHVIPFRPRPATRFNLKAITQTLMQPRLAMTAAMAFFSITLTLNLTGVHVGDLKASDLTPSNLKHSFYHANASVVRYYDNLRVVYELESRVNDLKRTSQGDNQHDDPAPAPRNDDQKKTSDQSKPRKAPKTGSGTSERRNPLGSEFKLAGYGRTLSRPETRMSITARASRSNKFKETLQEGVLV